MARILLVVLALISWPALGYQLGNIVTSMMADGYSLAAGLGRYVGYYTILTNLVVASLATVMALNVQTVWTGARSRFAVAVSIIMVGIIYSVALRHLNPTEGLGRLADHAVHDMAPILFGLVWFLMRDGSLSWRDIIYAVIGPSVYTVYILLRGAITSWYPYWFLDVSESGWLTVSVNITILVAVFSACGAVLIWIDKALMRGLAGPNSGH